MRYRGGGVSHLGTRQCNKILLADEHAPPDISDNVDPAKQGEDRGSDLEGEASGGEDNGDPVLRYCRNVRPTWVRFQQQRH